MRQWSVHSPAQDANTVLAAAIPQLGEPGFHQLLLDRLHPVLPAASWSVYRTGAGCEPAIFMSASHGIPDTTLDCWRAYLSGPYRTDRTLWREHPAAHAAEGLISHITAQEVPHEHRAKVYEAHGMMERVSIVQAQQGGALFAINFYRHAHQQPFSDAQIDNFGVLAPVLMALAHKHLRLRGALPLPQEAAAPATPAPKGALAWRAQQVQRLDAALTARECEVCAGVLLGMSFDGIACELGLSVATVKTYRNRAFARLGLHFRNELFALAWRKGIATTPRAGH